MTDYTTAELEQKFMNAHNAGDTKAAKLLKNMIVEQDSGQAPEQKSWEANDGGNIFENLTQSDQHSQDLKDAYRDREGSDFEGDVKDLNEDLFEYYNSSLNNELSLAGTAADIYKMDDKQKARELRMFEMYNNTNITGEGSRSTWEQTKDAGSLLWAPSTYLGGKFIAGGAMRAAGKTGIRKLLSGVGARSAVVGASILGPLDAGTQVGIDMQLDKDKEFDWERAGTSTALGAGFGAVAPIALKGAGKLLSGTGAVVKGAARAIAKPIDTIRDTAARHLGGGQAAREGVVEEVGETLGAKLGDDGKAESSESLHGSLGEVIDKGKKLFTRRYDDLGEVKVTSDEVEGLVKDLHKKPGVSRIGNLDDVITAMKGGELTPTQALRKVRSTLGKEADRSKRGIGSNTASDQVLGRFYQSSRNLFANAAEKAGKGNLAKELDRDYSSFLGIRGNTSTRNAAKDASAATRKLNQAVTSKDPHKITEFLDEMEELGRVAGDPDFSKLQKSNLQKTLKEHLMTGTKPGVKLKSFLGDDSGLKTIQKVFDDVMDEKAWKGYSDILKNAHDYGAVGILMSRMIAAFGGGMGAGPTGMIGALIGFEAMLKSTWFKKAAMKVFSGNPKAKSKGLEFIEKRVGREFDPDTASKIMNLLTGAGTYGTIAYQARDTSPEEIEKEVSSKLKSIAPSLMPYL